MKQLKSHDFPEVYKWLGINLNTLGCVVLDVEPIVISHWIGQDSRTAYMQYLPLYYAKNKERFWINGLVLDKAHITLLYGLLEQGKNFESHISKVLDGWKMEDVEIESFCYFESPYPDEEYYCIVAHIKVTPELMEGHQRLEFLPHINTFAGYKPHMTVAYIDKNEQWRDKFIEDLSKEYVGKKLKLKNNKFR